MPDDTVEWTDAQREELRRLLDGGRRTLRGRIVRRHNNPRSIVDSPEEIAAWLVTGDA